MLHGLIYYCFGNEVGEFLRGLELFGGGKRQRDDDTHF